MSDYYQPTLLFRQNALRRFNPSLSPISSVESLVSVTPMDSCSSASSQNSPYMRKGDANFSRTSWLLNLDNPRDSEVLTKSCSINRTNVKSNYWKIPDDKMNLTSVSITKGNATCGNNPLLAISSGNNRDNLFIYELDSSSNHLIHHSTISLSTIHGMKWVAEPSSDKNYIITGNNKGYAHLVSIPDAIYGEVAQDSDEGSSAEICKRFNHRKSVKDKKSISLSTPISKLDVFNGNREMISIYDDYLFHWDVKNADSQRRPHPLSITTIAGVRNFDPWRNNSNNNSITTTIGICGKFGISLFDTRNARFNTPSNNLSFKTNYRQLSANTIRWDPFNDNVLAAGHGDGVVRLWDVRKQDYFASLTPHPRGKGRGKYSIPQLTSMEWAHGDLVTGGQDGNIIHWDLTSDLDLNAVGQLSCGLREGFDSVNFNDRSNSLDVDVNQRQCGTILPASNTNIVSMCSVEVDNDDDNGKEIKIISIDGSSFLGVHSRVRESVDLNLHHDGGAYYTEQDLEMLLREVRSGSNSDTEEVDSIPEGLMELESERPLVVSRKPTAIHSLDMHSSASGSGSGSGSDTEVEVDNSGCSVDVDLTASPVFNQEEIEVISINESEFNLCSPVDSGPGPGSGSGSDSDLSTSGSPQSEPVNDSVDSLSTLATDVDACAMAEEGKHGPGVVPLANKTGLTRTSSGNEFKHFKYIFSSLDDLGILQEHI
ncbi:uncharacterized protein LODBEIA_P37440 [Lodderomyces beijingensis]|uniref:Protein DSE1 n=1 Tax=Lodderomyces beijingensis TaxID=1775926 RepID=A0ABP0ZMZ8_9ASCO